MRRFLGGILLALCLLTGCANDPSQPVDPSGPVDPTDQALIDLTPIPGKDADNRYQLFTGRNFQETADFYFCGEFDSKFGGEYLQYYDKSSGISGVLCADPTCTHTSSACGAYISSGAASLSCYDGKLYRIDDSQGRQTVLYRSDLSGTKREEVLQLDWEKVILAYQPQRYVIHRGYLYMLCKNSSLDGAHAQYLVSLLSVPLDGKQEPTVLYEKKTEGYHEATYRFVGNAVYVGMVTSSSDTDTYDIDISRYDTQGKIWEQLYEEKNIPAQIGKMWVTEEGEIYLPGMMDDQAVIWKLENGIRQQTAIWDSTDEIAPYLLDGVAVQISVRENRRWLDIVSFDGEQLYSGEMFPDSIPGLKKDPGRVDVHAKPMNRYDYTIALVGGDRQKLIVTLETDPPESDSITILMDITDNLKATILWSKSRNNL